MESKTTGYPPLVTIGIPTYNRINSLERAIKCAINQTYKNLEIIISDNATPGADVEILVKGYMRSDSRISFKKHTDNFGLEKNFQYVINVANGKYLLLAADDDIRSLNFVEENVDFLENNSDYVASTSPVRFEGGVFDRFAMGDNSIQDQNGEDRIIRFLDRWHANGRFFSLIRRKELQTSFNSEHFLGNDWVVILKLLKFGKFKRIGEGEVILGRNGISHNDIFSKYRTGVINLVIPFKNLILISFKLLYKAKLRKKILLSINLLKLNFTAFIWQSKVLLYELYKKITS
jgi:glycosyltransferase involved in cell wall biosynthesis